MQILGVSAITIESSLDKSALETSAVDKSAAETSVDKSALVGVKAQDDLGEEELLTTKDEFQDAVRNACDIVEEKKEPATTQFVSDNDDFDDDELLTAGLDSDEQVDEPSSKVIDEDDISDEDEDLLAD